MHNPNTIMRLIAGCFFVLAIVAGEIDIYDEIYGYALSPGRVGLQEFLIWSGFLNAIPMIGLLATLIFRGKSLPLTRFAIGALYLLAHGFYALNGPSPPEGAGHMHMLLVPPLLAVLCIPLLALPPIYLSITRKLSELSPEN